MLKEVCKETPLYSELYSWKTDFLGAIVNC